MLKKKKTVHRSFTVTVTDAPIPSCASSYERIFNYKSTSFNFLNSDVSQAAPEWVCACVFSLVEKRLWTARVTLSEGSSRHSARQDRAWPWTVGDSSIRRAKSTFWMRNSWGRKHVSSGSWQSSDLLSGCSSKTITTSTEKRRCTIYSSQRSQVREMWRSTKF